MSQIKNRRLSAQNGIDPRWRETLRDYFAAIWWVLTRSFALLAGAGIILGIIADVPELNTNEDLIWVRDTFGTIIASCIYLIKYDILYFCFWVLLLATIKWLLFDLPKRDLNSKLDKKRELTKATARQSKTAKQKKREREKMKRKQSVSARRKR